MASAKSGILRAPDGARIVGQLVNVTAIAGIEEIARRKNGELVISWTGKTDVQWQNQSSATFDGEDVFVDEDGSEWRESDLVVADE